MCNYRKNLNQADALYTKAIASPEANDREKGDQRRRAGTGMIQSLTPISVVCAAIVDRLRQIEGN
jgi:hypothetical protein